MTILIKRKDYVYNITFGRHNPWCDQVYLISIIREYYKNRSVVYADFIKGFFVGKQYK